MNAQLLTAGPQFDPSAIYRRRDGIYATDLLIAGWEIVRVANEASYLVFNDWIPVDAESWQRLETVRVSSFDRSWLRAEDTTATTPNLPGD